MMTNPIARPEAGSVTLEWEPDLLAAGWRLPVGRPLALPGRGRTFVRELPGPPGAPVLVLLHGLGATGGLNWFSSMTPLADKFRVIAIDHRGHGRGVRTRRFRLADCADDAACLTEVLRIDRFIAVGYSMGGPMPNCCGIAIGPRSPAWSFARPVAISVAILGNGSNSPGWGRSRRRPRCRYPASRWGRPGL
jgi:pimeloyl-ACP methyl ester carboxylesterase